jgi:hypothetical protein
MRRYEGRAIFLFGSREIKIWMRLDSATDSAAYDKTYAVKKYLEVFIPGHHMKSGELAEHLMDKFGLSACEINNDMSQSKLGVVVYDS